MPEESLVGLCTGFVAGIAIRDKLVAPHRAELASVLADVPWPASLAVVRFKMARMEEPDAPEADDPKTSG